jgi:hypothetical protein
VSSNGCRPATSEANFAAADVTKSAEVRGYVKAALDTYGAIYCQRTYLVSACSLAILLEDNSA